MAKRLFKLIVDRHQMRKKYITSKKIDI